MFKLFILIILICTVTFIAGCTNLGTPDPTPIKESPNPTIEEPRLTPKPTIEEPKIDTLRLFPLSQGSTWRYKGEGNEYASFNSKVLFVKGNSAQIYEDNGGTVSTSVFKSTENEIVRVYFEGEEYIKTNLLDSEPNDNLVILKAPIEVGTKWKNTEDSREIVDINASVNTPMGKVDGCIKVSILSYDSTMYEYFKEGIGMVRREFISGKMTVTSTLEKYNLK